MIKRATGKYESNRLPVISRLHLQALVNVGQLMQLIQQ